MAKISDFDAEYKAYKQSQLVTTFKSNLWGEQETFRRLLGPDSVIDNYEVYFNYKVIQVVDPINWNHPVCCDTCREEARIRNEKKEREQLNV